MNNAGGTEVLLTPIASTVIHHPRMPTSLLLGQPRMTSEPVTTYPYDQQEVFMPFQPRQARHEANFQVTESCVPLSPVSPVLEHPLAADQVVSDAPTPAITANQVVPDAPTPATAAPHSTMFAFKLEHQEEEEDALVLMDPAVDISPELAQAQAQAAEKLRKLRERRHTVACTFCRGRKVCFHAWFIVLEHAY